MESESIRRKFLQYFEKKGHVIVPSSSVLPHDDPTLLFINAGMNQFKDVFLGKSKRDYTSCTSSQKCIRVGGKHNDLENVGHTARHLTFFEMLGNFSFGDYFKEEAIQYAFEVATEVFGFDKEKLYASVFLDDDESYELWRKYLPSEKICRFGEKDNFWTMGDTGPCGPCSELYFDKGPSFGDEPLQQNPDSDRYFEFWNLVFMEFNRKDQNTIEELPLKCVDTGSGLERVVSLIMGVDSVFETDILRALISKIEDISKTQYDPQDQKTAPAFHVIADHLRTLAFAISDGVQPSNIDRGYVLRKVLRRAVRYGRMLGHDKPFLAQLIPTLIELMGKDYREISIAKERIEEILTMEEESFLRTLRRGGNILSDVILHAKKAKKVISGDDAFKLKDTYGLPLEEILLIAKDEVLVVDKKRFFELEKEAKERSRKAHKKMEEVAEVNLFKIFSENHPPSEFVGYTDHQTDAKVLAIIKDNAFCDTLKEGEEGIILVDKTPFYAEKGGQVGDTGTISSDHLVFTVTDCKTPYQGVIAHVGKLKQGTLTTNQQVTIKIDHNRRQKIERNHTATHLLHWALQKVLGEHIKQAGSVVDDKRLRFDFSHHKALTPDEIQKIEDLVNEKIRSNTAVKNYIIPYKEAVKKEEIKQFFGDKYDTDVRVIDIDFSKELCGGTHTNAIGNIGYFRIKSEGSIASGIRRIEAVTGAQAEKLVRNTEHMVKDLAAYLKSTPDKLKDKVYSLLEEKKLLEKSTQELKQASYQQNIQAILQKKHEIQGIPVVASVVDIPAKELRAFSDLLMDRLKSGVIILGQKDSQRCQIIAKVSQEYIQKGIHAVDIINKLCPAIEGKGGGKKDHAQAGGKAPHHLEDAISKVSEIF